MSVFNQLKKNLLTCLVVLVFLGISHFAHGNSSTEFSAHFGKKFQDYGAWNLGLDTLYRVPINENSSFGLGARYRFFFKSESANSLTGSRKRNKHRLALLVNYRFHIKPFFVGVVLGIDLWKHFSESGSINISGSDLTMDVSSNEFLWNKLTSQIGVEVGYKIASNFLLKLETGYDLLSFKNCSESTESNNLGTEQESTITAGEYECNRKFNGVYATVGVGYHF